jgi:hypothetical protein
MVRGQKSCCGTTPSGDRHKIGKYYTCSSLVSVAPVCMVPLPKTLSQPCLPFPLVRTLGVRRTIGDCLACVLSLVSQETRPGY